MLKKRDNYRTTFDNFDVKIISHYNHSKINRLLKDSGIICNKLKIQAVITNSQAFLQVTEEWGNFSDYIWHFISEHLVQNHWQTSKQVPHLPLRFPM
ncbi:DNA-3-methyladenine glycosylase I [Coxiella-like endosymbiont]|uniref:DNA-3-methyladenine glycosylase I n=1 Tax=Coxiella-like endosymbiont TaxID=1592897 RepID=UPI00272AE5ED|nr:DNA-3-methyladenine glycosylase I [Coxiella-like endosymbiont]